MKYDAIAQALIVLLDLKAKFELLAEIRDGLDNYCQPPNYAIFLEKYFNIFTSIFNESPVFINTAPKQRIRKLALDILFKVPCSQTEVSETFAPKIMEKCMELIRTDNDENAIICVKIIMDLQRHHPTPCAPQLQPFLDLILELFDAMETATKEQFDDLSPPVASDVNPGTPVGTSSPRPPSPSTAGINITGEANPDLQTRQLPRAMQSFKVIAECPILVVTILQAHRELAAANVKAFLPRIKNMLMIQAKPQQRGHEEAAAKGQRFTNIAKEIGMDPVKRSAFGDLITAQVKAMSFLAYLLKAYQDIMEGFIPQLPGIVIRLLQDCPREKAATRKELLVAIRHAVNFNVRIAFLPVLDDLMDEQTLIGDGLTVHDNSRYLAYTMLADLIHHVRDQLTPNQIRKAIVVFSKNLNDDDPGSNFQIMSAKLLFNMADCMAKVEDKQDARYFLMTVLNAVAEKCLRMNRVFDNAVKISKKKSDNMVETPVETYLISKDQPPDWDQIDIFDAGPLKTSTHRFHDPVQDHKNIFRAMVQHLKTMFFQLRATNPPDMPDAAILPPNWSELAFGFSADEVQILIKLFHEGCKMFRYYDPDRSSENFAEVPGPTFFNQHLMSSGKEEKELLEAFASIFSHLDPSTFYELFQDQLPHFYHMVCEHSALLHIPQFLLASESTSPPFCAMLLQFLMTKLDEVGTSDVQTSSVILRIFKLTFMAITLFAQHNEIVILPHIIPILTRSIELSVTAPEPLNYFLLLRSLFRSIGGGRFELLYKEILPLLEMLLDVLNNLLASSKKQSDRDLYVELALTMPARLSHLIPHLSYLMRPITLALRSSSDIVIQGIRTLELCIDNLTAGYLDPIVAPVLNDLMSALFSHLRPAPYKHEYSHNVMRLIGKIGGRNRKFITMIPNVEFRPYVDDEASFDVRFIGANKDYPLPIRLGYQVAIDRLKDVPKLPAAKKSDLYHKQQSINLIKSQIKLLIGADNLQSDYAQLLRLQAQDLAAKNYESVEVDLFAVSQRDKSEVKKDVQQEMLIELLNCAVYATSIPALKDDISAFLVNIYRHFTILEFGRGFASEVHKSKPFDTLDGEGPVVIDSRLISEVIANTLASEDATVREEALVAMNTIWSTAALIFGKEELTESLPFFNHLISTFTHNCYEEEWFTKSGGVKGLELAISSLKFSDEWLRERQNEMIAALMFSIKDTPHDMPARIRSKADELIQILLRRTVKGMNVEEVQDPQSPLNKLINRILMETSHQNRHVRSAARDALSTVAEVFGKETWEVVKPVKELMLGHIFNKPLRALPTSVQIGYTEALTFCAGLGNDVLLFDERLARSIMETLALADADDELLSLTSTEYRASESIRGLRVACYKLLMAAYRMPDFQREQFQLARNKTLFVFYKGIHSKNKEVKSTAIEGLELILTLNPKVYKDLLNVGMKPVMQTMQESRRITVDGITAMRSLAVLLGSHFKAELGPHLVELLKNVVDIPSLQTASFQMIDYNPKIKIVASVFDVLRFLPTAPEDVYKRIIDKILRLEEALRKTRITPFREPILEYTTKYPAEAWSYFAENIKDQAKSRFLTQLLEVPGGAALRTQLGEVENFVDLLNSGTNEAEEDVLAVNIISIIHMVCTTDEVAGRKLLANEALRTRVLEAAKSLLKKSKNGTIAGPFRLAADGCNDKAMDILSKYIMDHPDDVDYLCVLVRSCSQGEVTVSHSLYNAIYKSIICSTDVELQKTIITRCLDIYNSRQELPYMKQFLFRNVLIPIYARDAQKNWDLVFDSPNRSALLDKTMIDLIHSRLWKNHSLDEISEEFVQPGVDHSRMEMLQFTSFILKYHPIAVVEQKKDIIMFAWLHIRLEDVINKFAAFCVVAYFINAYETPAKIAIQVYSRLLTGHQAEARTLVLQALEILEPVLRKRAPDIPGRTAIWARIARKILSEDSNNTQQLTCIYQFIVRHPDLFYEQRDAFTNFIIPTLGRICQLPNASLDHRRLALGLMTTIWTWESNAIVEYNSSSRNGSDISNGRLQVPSLNCRTILIKYIVQFIASGQERYSGPFDLTPSEILPSAQTVAEIIRKSLGLLYKFLSPGFWDDIDIDAMFPRITEQILMSEPKKDEKFDIWLIRVVNTLQMLRVFVNVKPDHWIVARLPQLQKLLIKPLKTEVVEIQDAIHSDTAKLEDYPTMRSLFKRIIDAVPDERPEDEMPDADDPSEDFISFISKIASDAIAANSTLVSINIFWAMSQKKTDSIDNHIPAMLKVLQSKLAKDHVNAQPPPQILAMQPAASTPPPENSDAAVNSRLLIKVVYILDSRIQILGDQRRAFLSVLGSLVERSAYHPFTDKLFAMLQQWIFESTEPVPSLKEKSAILIKMLGYENRADPRLYHQFLDLVIKIYEDPKIYRTELSVRLEQAFLIGLRCPDIPLRTRYMTIFDKSLSRTLGNRIYKLIVEQQWDILSESCWLSQVIHLLFGSFEMNHPTSLHPEDCRTFPISKFASPYTGDARVSGMIVEDELDLFVSAHRRFVQELGDVKSRDLLEPLVNLQHTDWNFCRDIWISVFPICWAALSKEDREDVETGLITLVTKEFHHRQMDRRPNTMQILLEGIARCKPRMKFPSHVMKFQAKTFDAWYIAATYLEDLALKPVVDTPAVRESNLDALVDLYSSLEETDLFYGTWRRRCLFVETNAALSYEQNGAWDKAQHMYEQAQIKARTGSLAYSQGEYMLWEDHWVYCAEKLQQWDILAEFAKHENLNDLFLEAKWRDVDMWANQNERDMLETLVRGVSDAPTPRKMYFSSFISLMKLFNKTEAPQDFAKTCDDSVQLSLRQWHKLPVNMTQAHVSILQNFQLIVELHDASVVCSSLASTNAANLELKSADLKLILGVWRERLPNFWDDINAWQDLITWRQHVFHMVNQVYIPLIPPGQTNATSISYPYRGYHEMAWAINRFAQVARKHQMSDVCIAQLDRIYQLPNIEIADAFVKLREQAKCHFQDKSKWTSGLEVILNTNLNFFGPHQKAEFYTLKGMYLAKLRQKDEANDAFGTALYFDIRSAKAWAKWGRYNDDLFKEEPRSLEKAANAMSCYLEAAGLYKSAKSRKLLSRILWLLSLDDGEGRLVKAWEQFKGETPVWYWITFIPQLLNNLSRTPNEAEIAHQLLSKLAKTYPQALYFQLRTSKEDMQTIRKSQEAKEKKDQKQRIVRESVDLKVNPLQANKPVLTNGSDVVTMNGDKSNETNANGDKIEVNGAESEEKPAEEDAVGKPKKPWDHTEVLMQTLKTSFPLLALSMETMIDQIQKYFKCQPDEDAYRLIIALLNDALSYVSRFPHLYSTTARIPGATETNIMKFSDSILPAHVRTAFYEDYVKVRPSMSVYISKLRKWRGKFEELLDRRTSRFELKQAPNLAEFRYNKFDEVEVPGQYLQHRDKNQDFTRIERFMPGVDMIRGINSCHRRLRIRGHDGTIHPFAIQHPTPRVSRREERIIQLFRIFNSVLNKQKESRKRNLQFHLPMMIPLSPAFRMVQDDTSYITLQGIYENYCRVQGMDRDEPLLFQVERSRHLQGVRTIYYSDCKLNSLTNHNILQAKEEQLQAQNIETFSAIQSKFIPSTLVLDHFTSIYETYSALWLFRRSFAHQLAAHSFLTFVMFIHSRTPSKIHISRSTGLIWSSEAIPGMASHQPRFHNAEAVPFRLTPNLQTVMGPIFTEGIFVCALMAIARCLTDSSVTTTTPQSSSTSTTTTTTEIDKTKDKNNTNGVVGATPNIASSPPNPSTNTASTSTVNNNDSINSTPSTNPSNNNNSNNSGNEITASNLESHLSIFIRDEISLWYTQQHKQSTSNGELRDIVQKNTDAVVNKALAIAAEPVFVYGQNIPSQTNNSSTTDGNKTTTNGNHNNTSNGESNGGNVGLGGDILPVNQSVLDLVAKAADPKVLGAMEAGWLPWL